ncbi:hypothetical protein BIV24_18670 [Streptomyces colonosanans]|uniref:Integral membrane protein n=1 Tax=Streptomyces colonosanans TaxID=1428652 RepID=A0A1S2P8H4_9ACTN|nr:hypothetical protein BIV24_18670 [Streptomyces colonosanans]
MVLFRIAVTCEAALALGQAVLAGSFLSGHYEALKMHELNAAITVVVALALIVAAVLLWRPGRGPGWPALASAALLVSEGLQVGMGYNRTLAVHIPLGVGIVAATLLMLVWAWRPAPGADHASRTEDAAEESA